MPQTSRGGSGRVIAISWDQHAGEAGSRAVAHLGLLSEGCRYTAVAVAPERRTCKHQALRLFVMSDPSGGRGAWMYARLNI